MSLIAAVTIQNVVVLDRFQILVCHAHSLLRMKFFSWVLPIESHPSRCSPTSEINSPPSSNDRGLYPNSGTPVLQFWVAMGALTTPAKTESAEDASVQEINSNGFISNWNTRLIFSRNDSTLVAFLFIHFASSLVLRLCTNPDSSSAD